MILAADQRTLILDLKVAPQKLDQLRVLIEADYLSPAPLYNPSIPVDPVLDK